MCNGHFFSFRFVHDAVLGVRVQVSNDRKLSSRWRSPRAPSSLYETKATLTAVLWDGANHLSPNFDRPNIYKNRDRHNSISDPSRNGETGTGWEAISLVGILFKE